MKKSLNSRSGFTLVELLITTLISILVLFATAVPFAAQGNFWANGTSQVEAQRDAQLVLSAIAQSARQMKIYVPAPIIPGQHEMLVFKPPSMMPGCSGDIIFEGGPAFGAGGGQLQMVNNCGAPFTTTLIDGARSRVTNFTVTPVSNKLFNVQLSVMHANRNTETLRTEIHLRNA